jgi:hypothetical protein
MPRVVRGATRPKMGPTISISSAANESSSAASLVFRSFGADWAHSFGARAQTTPASGSPAHAHKMIKYFPLFQVASAEPAASYGRAAAIQIYGRRLPARQRVASFAPERRPFAGSSQVRRLGGALSGWRRPTRPRPQSLATQLTVTGCRRAPRGDDRTDGGGGLVALACRRRISLLDDCLLCLCRLGAPTRQTDALSSDCLLIVLLLFSSPRRADRLRVVRKPPAGRKQTGSGAPDRPGRRRRRASCEPGAKFMIIIHAFGGGGA